MQEAYLVSCSMYFHAAAPRRHNEVKATAQQHVKTPHWLGGRHYRSSTIKETLVLCRFHLSRLIKSSRAASLQLALMTVLALFIMASSGLKGSTTSVTLFFAVVCMW